ncbi:MAG: hypothetical protein L0Z50_39960 [Verrucomicrobiales bacterium]|nr:hypothetical protein [Verrucomicrobiales bacterium]
MPVGHKGGTQHRVHWRHESDADSDTPAWNQLWGIYYTDREYARVYGDPLRTVVEAPTKLAAQEVAARLGFGESWANPVRTEEAKHVQWLPTCRAGHRQSPNKHFSGICV